MLLSGQAITDVTNILTGQEFYRPANAAIFTAITQLVASGEPVDAVTVGAELDRSGLLQRVGGLEHLFDLIQSPPAASAAASYARIVAEKSRLRRLGELGVRLQQLAQTEGASGPDVDELVGQAETYFREQHEPSNTALSFDQLVAAWRTDQSGGPGGIPTPWDELNLFLNGGYYRGKMITVAGRPGAGKSLIGLNVAAMAAERGFKATVFSLEMGSVEVASRLISAGAGVQLGQLIRRKMDLETNGRVETYIADGAGMNLEIVDQPRITVEQIVSHCRATKPDVIVVDYLQLIAATDSKVGREQQIAHMSRTLKVAAGELNASIWLCAQLNRGGVDKDGKARLPVVSDIRESGAVEQDSDVILLLHRDASDDGVVKMVVGKNRNGRQGLIELPFRGDVATIGYARG